MTIESKSSFLNGLAVGSVVDRLPRIERVDGEPALRDRHAHEHAIRSMAWNKFTDEEPALRDRQAHEHAIRPVSIL